MTLVLRYMEIPDIPQVVVIDKASFDPAWPERSYRFEINESQISHMLVLENITQTPAEPHQETHWQRWLNILRGQNGSTPNPNQILGYGGLWKIEDEAHISTIAAHPQTRGRGYGEILLAAMMRRAIELGAGYIVLEVRVSNIVAQNLYTKYEFETVGVKRNYYRSNNEDAYDMRVRLDDAKLLSRFYDRFEALEDRFGFLDQYTETPHPRLKK